MAGIDYYSQQSPALSQFTVTWLLIAYILTQSSPHYIIYIDGILILFTFQGVPRCPCQAGSHMPSPTPSVRQSREVQASPVQDLFLKIHHQSRGGYQSKVSAVTNWLVPSTIKKVSWFCKFLQKFHSKFKLH